MSTGYPRKGASKEEGRGMRRYVILAAAVVALAIPAAALALVNLQPSQVGTTCAFGGTWHFVANHTDGATSPGTLTADFSGGQVIATADHISGGTQQWTTTGLGTLNGATSTVGGKLVLSDFTCSAKKG